MRHRRPAALAWVTFGAFLFALMFMLPKLATPGVPPAEVAFLRYLAGFSTIYPIYLYAGRRRQGPTSPRSAPRRIYVLHVLRALFGIISVACGAYAVTHIPLANAQAIAMTNGVFAVALAVLVLRERLAVSDVLAGTVCLIGAVVVAEPNFADPGWISLGALAALVQALAWGGEVVLLKATVVRDSAPRILAIVNGSACLMLALSGVLWWQPIALADAAILAAMGPVAILGQYCNIRGFRLADATYLVPIKYSGVVFAALLGVLVFGEWPSGAALIGAAMICAGAYLLARSKGV